jgi:hypothetical protein
MGDLSDATNVFSSPTAGQNMTTMGTPKTRKNRSAVWNDFTLDPESEKIVICDHCGKKLKYNGTSSMTTHLKGCKNNPNSEANKRQRNNPSSINVEGQVISSPLVPSFDQEKLRYLLVKMFVGMELPFNKVEHPDFEEFVNGLNPKFNLISRTTLARDTLLLWDVEKAKLKNFLAQHCHRVSLTADTWTSIQNLCYMCITAHFIDNNWTLQSRVLSFCQVTSHSGDVIANTIDNCLTDWGLNRVLTITLDNASSNDLGIKHLKKKLLSCNSLLLKGEYLHLRCCAHVLNLIVKEGLKDVDDSVLRIRGSVKYARSSPHRFSKFKTSVERSNTEYKGLVCLDVETRWNSTYLMLDSALKHQKAFEVLEIQDPKYSEELVEKGKGVPTYMDWEEAQAILPFLKIFYDATLRISGSSYVASNMYMLEVFDIGSQINKMCNSDDVFLKSMALKMRKKYDKYWGKIEHLNMLLMISTVLDPRYKLKYVNWSIDDNFKPPEAKELKELLETNLYQLFAEYSGVGQGFQSGSQLSLGGMEDRYSYNRFLQSIGSSSAQTDLQKYLDESLESQFSDDFDILRWWKENSTRLPILAKMAKDLFVIPISTVPSESTFSLGGRVIDEHRSCLTPKMVEALVCSYSCIKGSRKSSIIESLIIEDYKELEKLEQGMMISLKAALKL